MIDVLVPVLRRPQNVAPLVESVRTMSHHVSRVLFICSEWDVEEIMAVNLVGAEHVDVNWRPSHADYPRKMNHGFSETTAPYVFLGADDITFTQGWDDEVLEVANSGAAGVIATNDMANPDVKRGVFGTHCLVRRSYVEELGGALEGPGVLLSEAYDHNYCDRELCHLADSRGLYAFAERSIVAHRHPHWGTAKTDKTYRKGMMRMRQDHKTFLARSARWTT